jgi:hypothetical protein
MTKWKSPPTYLIIDWIVKSITNYLANYQTTLKELVRNKYEIIGYARKPPTKDDEQSKIRLLTAMINNLEKRSFVDKVFVSPSAYASATFTNRDDNPRWKIIRNQNAIY